jgi:hypothetical protein
MRAASEARASSFREVHRDERATRDDRADAFCWGVHDLALGDQFFAF